MTRLEYAQRLIAFAAISSLLAAGCSPEASPTVAAGSRHAPSRAISIERAPQAEAVLRQLGRRAWVFRHGGGKLTSELAIFHRPEGPGMRESQVFVARGDDAVLASLARSKTGMEQPPSSGYLIVTLPAPPFVENEHVVHSFSIDGVQATQTSALHKFLSKPYTADTVRSVSEEAVDKAIDLQPGENKVLINYIERFTSRGSPRPHGEREVLRFELTVTALAGGRLPSHDVLRSRQ